MIELLEHIHRFRVDDGGRITLIKIPKGMMERIKEEVRKTLVDPSVIQNQTSAEIYGIRVVESVCVPPGEVWIFSPVEGVLEFFDKGGRHESENCQ